MTVESVGATVVMFVSVACSAAEEPTISSNIDAFVTSSRSARFSSCSRSFRRRISSSATSSFRRASTCSVISIPPPAQRSMSKRAGATMVEADGSHAVYVSKPEAVAQLIEQAAKSLERNPAMADRGSMASVLFAALPIHDRIPRGGWADPDWGRSPSASPTRLWVSAPLTTWQTLRPSFQGFLSALPASIARADQAAGSDVSAARNSTNASFASSKVRTTPPD